MVHPFTSIQWPTWPIYNSDDKDSVLKVIESNQLFAADNVRLFEGAFADYTNSPYAIGVGNATQGLHLALAALSIGVGDEVIVPNYSFISTASCVLMQNAIPIFVDCERDTLAPSVGMIQDKISCNTKAVIITHLWGFPCKIAEIRDLCAVHNIPLIEDCSHAHGAKYHNCHVGTFGDISVFSLHQRKNLPVGDGGICLIKDANLRDKIFKLRSFGDAELSYNYRMTEFAGALGVSRLRQLDLQNIERCKTAALLDDILTPISWIDSIKPLPDCEAVYHAYILLLDPETSPLPIHEFISRANNVGIPFKKTWQPLHQHPHFNPDRPPARGLPWDLVSNAPNHELSSYADQSFPISDYLINHSIVQLDIHPGTTIDHVEFVKSFLSSI